MSYTPAVNNAQQQTVLPSSRDTTNGRTSAYFTNPNASGCYILIQVSAQTGLGKITAISLQTKDLVGGVARTIATFGSLNIAAPAVGGLSAFYVYPVSAAANGSVSGFMPGSLPPQVRLVTTAVTDNAGNDITYSADLAFVP